VRIAITSGNPQRLIDAVRWLRRAGLEVTTEDSELRSHIGTRRIPSSRTRPQTLTFPDTTQPETIHGAYTSGQSGQRTEFTVVRRVQTGRRTVIPFRLRSMHFAPLVESSSAQPAEAQAVPEARPDQPVTNARTDNRYERHLNL
jgi:hypothetical protein